MDQNPLRDLLLRDKTILDLRALILTYERRLAELENRTATASPAPAYDLPLLSINGVSYAVENPRGQTTKTISGALEDWSKQSESEPFPHISRLSEGSFRVHPRLNGISIGVIGPFPRPAPFCVAATARTSHAQGPTIRYCISLCSGSNVQERNVERVLGVDASFLAVPPNRTAILSFMNDTCTDDWAVVLATVADPADVVDYAWAEFKDIIAYFGNGESALLV